MYYSNLSHKHFTIPDSYSAWHDFTFVFFYLHLFIFSNFLVNFLVIFLFSYIAFKIWFILLWIKITYIIIIDLNTHANIEYFQKLVFTWHNCIEINWEKLKWSSHNSATSKPFKGYFKTKKHGHTVFKTFQLLIHLFI